MIRIILWPFKALETLLTLAWARLLVGVVPFRMWRARIGPLATDADAAPPQVSAAQLYNARAIGRRVRRCAHHAPFSAVCLPQAMAARWMLDRRGIPSAMFFGARPDKGEGIARMHAWLMCGDVCLTGGQEREEFRSFTAGRPHPVRSGE